MSRTLRSQSTAKSPRHALQGPRPRRGRLAFALCTLLAPAAYAAEESSADATQSPGSNARLLDKVSVLGSQIAGGGAQAALPVVAVDREQIDATGATNGNELFRSLPQFGDVAVTEKGTTNAGRNSNVARGDVGSINLRNLGAKYTLLLVNGRRTVQHPISNSGDDTTYNANAIPTFGLERVNLLLDGAASIYGSDAVAGVVDLVTPSNLPNGGGIKLNYGKVADGHREDISLDGYFGSDFAQGRGNISVLYGVSKRTAQRNSDAWFTATDGRRPLGDGTSVPDPNGTSGFSTRTPWGHFDTYAGSRRTGSWHVDPASGALVSGAVPTRYHYDSAAEPGITSAPAINKGNVFASGRFDATDNLQVFGELGYYRATSESWVSSESGFGGDGFLLHIRPDAYWVPDALRGADAIRLLNYQFADSGIRRVKVDNDQSRVLLGVRGWTDGGWNWETALLYSRARSTDTQQGGLTDAFIAAVNRTDAGAYNPFSGGDPASIRLGDATPYDTSAFIGEATREGTTELALWDFKINRSDLFTWYAGDIGLAAGVEYRYESREDDRDENIDGSRPYTDWYTGTVAASNFFTHSPRPDVRGSRNVKSALIELAVPLISPAQGIPLVQSLDLQLAGRWEDYSDAGKVAKPKLAAAWKVNDNLLLRGSVSGGFRAPGLELVNSPPTYGFGFNNDAIRCHALISKGAQPDYSACLNAYSSGSAVKPSVSAVTSYGDDVKPETTRQSSWGAVFEPQFLPESLGSISLSVDAWRVQVENPINTLGEELLYDAYLRVVEGSSNPNVVRAAVTAEDAALFAGSGLAPAGVVTHIYNRYQNRRPLTASGVDYNFTWRLRETAWGNFALLLSVSQLKEYTQQKPAEVQQVAAAIANGQLNIIAPDLGAANEVGINGAKPEWRASATLIWNLQDWTVRLRDDYIDSVTAGAYSDRTPFVVGSTQRWALSVKKEFNTGRLKGTAVEVGARNLFDKEPPLNATGSYLSALHETYGRYVHLGISKNW
ncbi:TonB-dependent receptor-like protein [Stenotrophomonas maltophilia]|uniref:TonB-dependent receptor domain-containing protein n=1 Tax=Stenotrophomonas chelatiphaga TaxID=517011 RepID=UPI000F4B58BD|nr:TonB-dependent receptor [Stenotrophomonas chelatiphaga]MCS4229824.1 outer membrane receptor protein involved in Fe transport [Stenotrophomonas chelatiphaga]ROQ38012.1 TonB-dependent receptor-like protein [Stenotrophomonas maltophilia]